MHKSFLTVSTLAILLLLSVPPQGCVAGELAAGNSIWWAPYLQLASLSGIDRALAQPVMDNGRSLKPTLLSATGQSKTVQSCNDFLDAVDQKMGPANQTVPVFPFITRCYALRYLKSVQAPRQNFLGGDWTDDVLERLPPFVFYAESSLVTKANQARERNESWEQFDPQLKVVSRTDRDLVLQDNQDRWSLTIVARGDFNGDGLEDQVVIACDSVRFGSGGVCLPLVLTATSPDHVMTLISSLSEPYHIVASSSGAR